MKETSPSSSSSLLCAPESCTCGVLSYACRGKAYAAEKYGTQYTGKVGEISVPATEKQTAARQRFATAHANANGLSEEEKAAYAEAFKQNKKGYKSLQGYIFAMEYAKLGN